MIDNVKIIFPRLIDYEPSLNCIGTIEMHQSTRSARIFFCCNFLAFSALALLGSNIFKNTLLTDEQYYLDIKEDASHTLQISTHPRSEKKSNRNIEEYCANFVTRAADLLLMAPKLHICICICAGCEMLGKNTDRRH